MDIKSLLNVNLNYLLYLDSLLKTQSVSKAAKNCCVSQPAMSYALRKLRLFLCDPLLYKDGHHYILTPHGRRLRTEVHHLMQHIAKLPSSNQTFDPRSHKRVFRIGSHEALEALVAPLFLEKLKEYPGVQIEFISGKASSTESELLKETYDFSLTYIDPGSEDLVSRVLFEDVFICLVSDEHPIIKQPLTISTFLSCSHVRLRETDGDFPFIDDILDAHGMEIPIILNTSQFLAAPYLLTQDESILMYPKKVYDALFTHLALSSYELPFNTPNLYARFHMHKKNQTDPGFIWFQDFVKSVFPNMH